jgi:hypothetical protein
LLDKVTDPYCLRVTREERLRNAVVNAIAGAVTASGTDDEQVMFEALGGCLAWLCALDDCLAEIHPHYRNQRNSDPAGLGQLLLGLRYARNAVLHGDQVASVADPETVPMPTVVVAVGAMRSHVIMPPTRIAWVFRGTLPTPPPPHARRQRQLMHEYRRVANQEVAVPINGAVTWVNKYLTMPI